MGRKQRRSPPAPFRRSGLGPPWPASSPGPAFPPLPPASHQINRKTRAIFYLTRDATWLPGFERHQTVIPLERVCGIGL